MRVPEHSKQLVFEQLYDQGRKLFLCGKCEEAIDKFKCIYADTLDFRDVAQMVDDYYTLPMGEWTAKWQARLQT